MKQVTENGIDYLLIKVPHWVKGHKYAAPPGRWQILGKATEITEEVAKGLIKQQMGGGKFYDYSIEGSSLGQYGCYILSTATESLLSFVRHHGFEPGECLVLRKQ